MPLRIHAALDTWRAAERHLAATQPGDPGRHDAEDAVVEARDTYLKVIAQVALEQGPDAMPDLSETQLNQLRLRATHKRDEDPS